MTSAELPSHHDADSSCRQQLADQQQLPRIDHCQQLLQAQSQLVSLHQKTAAGQLLAVS